MKHIPNTLDGPVLRTDFSDDTGWQAVCTAIQQPVGEFRAYVEFVNDPDYDGLDLSQVPSLIAPETGPTFIFIVDHITISNPEHPILVMDLYDEPGRTFRVIPAEMYSVENNLSIANMDFRDFANAIDQDGIFRGFR